MRGVKMGESRNIILKAYISLWLLKMLDPSRDNEAIFSQRAFLLNHELIGIPQRFNTLLFRSFD